jgi:CRAL/TRIO domain
MVKVKKRQRRTNDNDTLPILLYMGDWDIAELMRRVRQKELSIQDDLLRYWIYILESLHRELYMQSLQYERMMYADEICLLLSPSSASTLLQPPSCLLSPYFLTKIARPVLTMMQAYYPETVQRIRLVHPTRFHSLVWNTMFKSLLKPGTRAKVELVPQKENPAVIHPPQHPPTKLR